MSQVTSRPERDAVFWRRAFAGRSTTIWIATVALFVVSPLVAPGSIGRAALLSMLPYAAVLAIVSAGQTLVVQQRGLDLSVPGQMAFAAVLATALPVSMSLPVWLAMALGIALPGVVGVINGLLVTKTKTMPLVVTLGMNALLYGTVLAISNGTPTAASRGLSSFALAKSAGIPNTVLIALILLVVVGFITQRSVVGRRLTAVGVSERAARALGLRVDLYQVIAYGFAGLCYGAGGVLLAGYTQNSALFLGDSYLLPTVAAVVLAGTALTGGLASVVAAGVAALFLTQLDQLLLSLGWPESTQLTVQALVLILVVLTREAIPLIARWRKKRVTMRAPAVHTTVRT
jgi:ribose transport system permease protein